MTDAFGDPTSGDLFVNKDHLGHLLLVTPTEEVKGMTTTAGVTDAIKGHVVHIDETDPASSTEYGETLIFGKVLGGQLRGKINSGIVLGVLTKLPAQPGKNAAWSLDPATDEQKDKARAYLATKAPQL